MPVTRGEFEGRVVTTITALFGMINDFGTMMTMDAELQEDIMKVVEILNSTQRDVAIVIGLDPDNTEA